MQRIDFQLRGDHISLDALLKATGLADSGGGAKHLIGEGKVQVDGQMELRRGCKLRAGQVIQLADTRIHLQQAPGIPEPASTTLRTAGAQPGRGSTPKRTSGRPKSAAPDRRATSKPGPGGLSRQAERSARQVSPASGAGEASSAPGPRTADARGVVRAKTGGASEVAPRAPRFTMKRRRAG